MEEKSIKLNGRKKWIFVVIAGMVVGACGYYYGNENNPSVNSMQVSFPSVNDLANSASFACEALLSSNIVGKTSDIEGAVSEGTDKVAMSIKDEKTLVFQTGASVSAGIAEGDNMAIIQNDKNKLMAVWFNENVTSTIVLNKNNGLAVWLKGNPSFPIYDAPFGNIVYMVCR